MAYSVTLSHSGRKGQRWGVRNGPPYPLKDVKTIPQYSKSEQKQIYKKFKDIGEKDRKELSKEAKEVIEAGIKHKLNRDVLQKGSKFIRYSDTMNESIDKYRKYGSITKNDVKYYKENAEAGVLSNKGSHVYMYEFKTMNSIKIARGEKVCKDVISKYGDKRIKDAYKAYLKVPTREHYHDIIANKDTKDGWTSAAVGDNEKALTDFMHKIFYDEKTSKEIYSKYKKKGYGGIVDPEDYLMGYYYPLIVLEPGKDLKLRKIKRIK